VQLADKCIGWGLTGSHCSYEEVLPQMERLMREGARVIPVLSPAVAETDTRFGTAKTLVERLVQLTGREPITSIVKAEPTGQKLLFDCFAIAPCTGNTLGKLANAVTDTPVLMAAKGTLRNLRPVVLAISTNDALGANARNLGNVLNMRHVYVVPFGQDNPDAKPNSCVADFGKIVETIQAALEGRQLQPVLVLVERSKRVVL
jgi:dipicolinate synthase subunit B